MQIIRKDGQRFEIEDRAGHFTARCRGRSARAFSNNSADEAIWRLLRFDREYRPASKFQVVRRVA